jgi:hypothetical protein
MLSFSVYCLLEHSFCLSPRSRQPKTFQSDTLEEVEALGPPALAQLPPAETRRALEIVLPPRTPAGRHTQVRGPVLWQRRREEEEGGGGRREEGEGGGEGNEEEEESV